jgi:hypothetical protein
MKGCHEHELYTGPRKVCIEQGNRLGFAPNNDFGTLLLDNGQGHADVAAPGLVHFFGLAVNILFKIFEILLAAFATDPGAFAIAFQSFLATLPVVLLTIHHHYRIARTAATAERSARRFVDILLATFEIHLLAIVGRNGR